MGPHSIISRRVVTRVGRAPIGAVCALAALAFAAAAPSAAAQWSSQTLSRAHSFVGPTGLGFTTSGVAVGSWEWQDGLGNDATYGASSASREASGPAFGGERELPNRVVSDSAPYASSRVIIARLIDRVASQPDTLRVQFGDVRGRFGAPRIVARASRIRDVELAVNARGAAALGWIEDSTTDERRLYVSLRRAGGSFSRPIALARERIGRISLAVGPAGHVLVAWDAGRRVRTRIKSGSSHGFRSADTVRSHDTFSASLDTAVSANGRAVVAWTAQEPGSDGENVGEAFVQAALRPAGSSRFRRALLLARAAASARRSPVSLALRADGTATVAWMISDGPPPTPITTVHAARITASSAPAISELARYAQVDPPFEAPTAAVDRDGNALVAWTVVLDPLANTTRVYASLQPPGGPWGAPELVSAGPHATAPVAAYPPADGPPIVLFSNRPTGQVSTTVAQVAARIE